MIEKLVAFFSRISVRLLTFNILIVFLPAAALLYLDTYERQLLRSLEHALIQQGRVLASALSGNSALQKEEAERILLRLEQRHEARLRVVDGEGRLLADSSRLGPRRNEIDEPAGSSVPTEERALYRLATYPVRLSRRLFRPPEPPLESAEFYVNTRVLLGPEIREALAGRYGAMTRISTGGQRSVTLYSAIPVEGEDKVIGAVLVSQSTYRILQDLYELRLDIFTVFLVSLAVAVGLSLVASTTIAVPVRKLRRQAREILDHRGRLLGPIRFNRRRDEIGDLSRSLEEMTRKLQDRIRFIESFAADISHEFKNPLASIRSASEMIPGAENESGRSRFLSLILREVARMQHLLSAVREISVIDAQLEGEERRPVDVGELLNNLIEAHRLRRLPEAQSVAVNLSVQSERSARGERSEPGYPIKVLTAPQRLIQVLENLLENALAFSPPGKEVTISLARERGRAVIRFEDRGPGIPEQHLEKIFQRFFSYRPQAESVDAPSTDTASADTASGHLGLGLAISRAIVEGYGGTIAASNRPRGGACFEVRLPLAGG